MTRKIILIISAFLTLTFLVMQVLFITAGQYTTAFVDHFEFPVLTSIFLAIPTVLLVYSMHVKRLTVVTIALCIFNILAALIIRSKLDKTNLTAYRQDFGIGAAYIYLDTTTNTYILERVSPMRMTVYTGKFRQDNSIIYLDKTFLRGTQETNSFDRQYLFPVK